MKWSGETRQQKERRQEEEGVLSLAWFPTMMDDGTWVWMERYWSFLRRGPNASIWWVSGINRDDVKPKPLSMPPKPKPTRK